MATIYCLALVRCACRHESRKHGQRGSLRFFFLCLTPSIHRLTDLDELRVALPYVPFPCLCANVLSLFFFLFGYFQTKHPYYCSLYSTPKFSCALFPALRSRIRRYSRGCLLRPSACPTSAEKRHDFHHHHEGKNLGRPRRHKARAPFPDVAGLCGSCPCKPKTTAQQRNAALFRNRASSTSRGDLPRKKTRLFQVNK